MTHGKGGAKTYMLISLVARGEFAASEGTVVTALALLCKA
jgi:hypothetical protein